MIIDLSPAALNFYKRNHPEKHGPRSAEYRKGYWHGCQLLIEGMDEISCPYAEGAVQRDAYILGSIHAMLALKTEGNVVTMDS